MRKASFVLFAVLAIQLVTATTSYSQKKYCDSVLSLGYESFDSMSAKNVLDVTQDAVCSNRVSSRGFGAGSTVPIENVPVNFDITDNRKKEEQYCSYSHDLFSDKSVYLDRVRKVSEAVIRAWADCRENAQVVHSVRLGDRSPQTVIYRIRNHDSALNVKIRNFNYNTKLLKCTLSGRNITPNKMVNKTVDGNGIELLCYRNTSNSVTISATVNNGGANLRAITIPGEFDVPSCDRNYLSLSQHPGCLHIVDNPRNYLAGVCQGQSESAFRFINGCPYEFTIVYAFRGNSGTADLGGSLPLSPLSSFQDHLCNANGPRGFAVIPRICKNLGATITFSKEGGTTINIIP